MKTMKTIEEKISWRKHRAIDLQIKLDHAIATNQNLGILEYAIKINQEELAKLISLL